MTEAKMLYSFNIIFADRKIRNVYLAQLRWVPINSFYYTFGLRNTRSFYLRICLFTFQILV
jgi:hypothetical protein